MSQTRAFFLFFHILHGRFCNEGRNSFSLKINQAKLHRSIRKEEFEKSWINMEILGFELPRSYKLLGEALNSQYGILSTNFTKRNSNQERKDKYFQKKWLAIKSCGSSLSSSTSAEASALISWTLLSQMLSISFQVSSLTLWVWQTNYRNN